MSDNTSKSTPVPRQWNPHRLFVEGVVMAREDGDGVEKVFIGLYEQEHPLDDDGRLVLSLYDARVDSPSKRQGAELVEELLQEAIDQWRSTTTR